ncbi:substrate-binding periplasmic protein [Paucibacter sp. M5-1]|nr:transporter substrate-binding domain-containing protein [Paucibacter sp. M5-1]MCZ7883053.1 transporter substrate-binding domain-containing protein [Paucibacter sp. M5-1]
MRHLLPRVALTCMLLWASSVSAQAVLKAALFEVAPYAQREGGELRGLYVDLVRELGASAGVQVEIALMPFARVPHALAQGEVELTIGFSTDALAAVSRPLGPVVWVESLVVMRPGSSATDLPQLQGALIGRARGGCQDLAQRVDLHLRLTDVSSFESALRMLALGRLDGLCLTRDVLHHYSAMASIERHRLGAEILVGQRPAMLYVRNDLAPDMVAKLRVALAKRRPIKLE